MLLIPAAANASYISIVNWLIPQFEDFSPHPYWDVSRWSWGYGTAAPGATGTITEADARDEMNDFVQHDYNYLSKLITRSLNANQWAALLSFDYNEGAGNADNLVTNINSGDDNALESQWKQYVYVKGVVSSNLVNRRNIEWQIWTGQY